MRTPAFILIAIAITACKTRDPSSAGLLDASSADATEQDAASSYAVQCVPSDDESVDLTYRLDVYGATSDAIDAPLTVSVSKTKDGATSLVASAAAGTGSVSRTGNVIVAFAGGVLSAELTPGVGTHVGMLTLLDEGDEAEGMPVRCSVAVKAPRG